MNSLDNHNPLNCHDPSAVAGLLQRGLNRFR